MCCSIEAYIWSTFFVFLQSQIFLLNCDVCCSFPLPEMLGKLLICGTISMSLIIAHHLLIIAPFLQFWYRCPEAHKKYGGMGTILVSKVSQFSLWIFLAEHSHFWFISYVCFSVSTCLGFGFCNWQVSAESANQFGELVADPVTNEVLHYTERPETFVCLIS